jgi:hypothetical protein
MLLVPLEVDKKVFDLFIILEDENLSRMRDNDPGEIKFPLPEPWASLAIRNIQLCHVSNQDMPKLMAIGRDPNKIARFLMRGWKRRPEDHDQGPQSLPNN